MRYNCGMKVVLAEKPSVARDLARTLGAKQRHEGWLEGEGWAVTWALGHLVELKDPEEYDPSLHRWSLETLPILPEPFELRPRGDDGARKQLDVIVDLFKQADEIVCATDAGREGELIFRYIQRWSGCEDTPFKRLWISSMTPAAIREGFDRLADGHDYDGLYQAARCRSEADWIVGLNGTRFFTLLFEGHGTPWSVGRVQTPVLAMIVGRDLEIDRFKPETYWEVHTLYRGARFKHTEGKLAAEERAREILEKVQGEELHITALRQKEERIPPPLLYDLTNLQKDMNKRWGLTADRTLQAAQALYERQFITYPRTDSRHLTGDMAPKLPGLLTKQADQRPEDVGRLDLAHLNVTRRIVDDKKVSDHHAIIPTEVLPSNLPPEQAKVYEAISTRFIAVFYPPCRKSVTTADAQSAGEPFRAVGRVVLDPGWQQLYPYLLKEKKNKKPGSDEEETQQMPPLEEGEHGPHEPAILEKQTKPPKRFTEASLLQGMETAGRQLDDDELKQAMKDKGLGTPATRAAIIETLLKRNYIQRQKKNLVSTLRGRYLVALVRDEQLKSPELTGEWEARLKSIERGRQDPGDFLRDVLAHTERILAQRAEGTDTKAELGPCPLCGAPVIEGRKDFGCSRWKEGCGYVLPREQHGVNLAPSQVRELLGAGALLHPVPLQLGDQKLFTRLKLGPEGAVLRDDVQASKEQAPPGALGPCPACGGWVVESPKAYGCAEWRSGCGFKIWKTMSGRNITKTAVKQVLAKGQSSVLKGFQSRAGNKFDAALKLEGDKVVFDFGSDRTS